MSRMVRGIGGGYTAKSQESLAGPLQRGDKAAMSMGIPSEMRETGAVDMGQGMNF